jgi:hypothetical protein
MRLDHLSYVTTHDQLADTVQRLGSRLGSTFVDGGIHPRFGTRNFTAPLLGNQYIEVVCPLDHPATELTPWGKAVSQKASEGGGWLTWVFSTGDIQFFETKFGRKSVEGHRKRPDGTELLWKQIGVKEIAEVRELPFFIEWLTQNHPSQDGIGVTKIRKIVIADESQLGESWFKDEILTALDQIQLAWDENLNAVRGITLIEFETPAGIVSID